MNNIITEKLSNKSQFDFISDDKQRRFSASANPKFNFQSVQSLIVNIKVLSFLVPFAFLIYSLEFKKGISLSFQCDLRYWLLYLLLLLFIFVLLVFLEVFLIFIEGKDFNKSVFIVHVFCIF